MNKVGIAFLILFLMVATPLWLGYESSQKTTQKDYTNSNYYYSETCNPDYNLCYHYEYKDAADDMQDKMTDVYDNLANWSDIGQKTISWMKNTIGWAADTVSNVKNKVKQFWSTAKGWFS